MHHLRSFLLLSLTAPCLLLTAACSDGGGGDKSRAPDDGVMGNGQRLSEVNNPQSASRPANNSYVSITGAVVNAVDLYDETGDGDSSGNLYVQDFGQNPQPFGGIIVFNATYSPANLKVFPGDVVDIWGVYQEFPGPASSPFEGGATLPEIVSGTVTLRFESNPPEPKTIDISELYDYKTGRQWLGMLVRVENVKLFDSLYVASSGRESARIDLGAGREVGKLPAINNALIKLSDLDVSWPKGKVFKSVTGVVSFFHNFTIAPRSKDDLVE